jgi:hypothetical protein
MTNPLTKISSCAEYVLYRNEDGKPHREDGPALELDDGSKYWFRNGELHQEGGPAVELPNGDKYWFRNDRQILKAGKNGLEILI